jgi:hypothetical protein
MIRPFSKQIPLTGWQSLRQTICDVIMSTDKRYRHNTSRDKPPAVMVSTEACFVFKVDSHVSRILNHTLDVEVNHTLVVAVFITWVLSGHRYPKSTLFEPKMIYFLYAHCQSDKLS